MFFPKRSTKIYEYDYYADELNESLGVTNNTKAIIRFFKDICSDCLKIASNVPINTSPQFDLLFCKQHDIVEQSNVTTHAFSFIIPKSHNTLEWLDDNTKIIIFCNNFNSEKDRKKDKIHGKGSASSGYHVYDSSSIAEFIFEFSFVENAIEKGFYIDNQWFANINAFEYGFQHEIHHIHKQTDSFEIKTANYQMNYNQIKSIYSNNKLSEEIHELSFIFYMFCIPDERNAYIEQFYAQYNSLNKKNRNYKNVEQWKKSDYYLNYLNTKRTEFVKQANDIFKWFNKPAKYFLKIKNENSNYIEFANNLIDKMIECITNAQRKYIRTTFIPESYYYTDYGRLLTQEKLLL